MSLGSSRNLRTSVFAFDACAREGKRLGIKEILTMVKESRPSIIPRGRKAPAQPERIEKRYIRKRREGVEWDLQRHRIDSRTTSSLNQAHVLNTKAKENNVGRAPRMRGVSKMPWMEYPFSFIAKAGKLATLLSWNTGV